MPCGNARASWSRAGFGAGPEPSATKQTTKNIQLPLFCFNFFFFFGSRDSKKYSLSFRTTSRTHGSKTLSKGFSAFLASQNLFSNVLKHSRPIRNLKFAGCGCNNISFNANRENGNKKHTPTRLNKRKRKAIDHLFCLALGVAASFSLSVAKELHG